MTAAAQLRRTQELSKANDVAILDPASTHHYQVGIAFLPAGLAQGLRASPLADRRSAPAY